jgi:pyruvate dehydrogenase E1 component alpha subunit
MPAKTTPQTTDAASKALAGNHGFSLISDEKLLALYAALLRCRSLEERVGELRRQQNWPRHHDIPGQEASVVAATIDLHAEDTVIAPPRCLIHAFMKGVPLDRILAVFKASAIRPKQSHPPVDVQGDRLAPWNHLSPASSHGAAQLNLANYAALLHKVRDDGKIAVAFSRWDSTDASGAEALRFASAQQLPILFVLRNAKPGKASPPLKGGQSATLAWALLKCDFPHIPVDGSDVVAVYRVASESIARIRQGRGPTLIECVDLPAVHSADPIATMETYLSRKGLFRPEFKAATLTEFSTVWREAFNRVGSALTPAP